MMVGWVMFRSRVTAVVPGWVSAYFKLARLDGTRLVISKRSISPSSIGNTSWSTGASLLRTGLARVPVMRRSAAHKREAIVFGDIVMLEDRIYTSNFKRFLNNKNHLSCHHGEEPTFYIARVCHIPEEEIVNREMSRRIGGD